MRRLLGHKRKADNGSRFVMQLRTSLVSAAISPDGKWLAVSDLYETKVYKLRYHVSP